MLLTFFAGYFVRGWQSGADDFPVLIQAYDLLIENGLPTPPAGHGLEYGMIRGMIQAYGDPFTSFSEPPQAELQSNTLHGSFGGIGSSLGRDNESNHVLLPFPDGPAAQAGILEGDRLLSVDGQAVTPEWTTDQVVSALRGAVGSKVRLEVGSKPDYTPREVSIERSEFPLPSVIWYLEPTEPRLGIIKVNIIAATTPEEIEKAVADLKERGATHFALDLRDNFGGLLDSGVNTARLFLREGTVIQEEYKNKAVKTYTVEKAGPLAELPLILLVNQNTASAAEIIAGALQAQQRALLIGVPTFGKDTVQFVFQLKDLSSLQVSAGRWWVPGLDLPRSRQGLQPDILLPEAPASVTEGNDPVVQAAIQAFFQPAP